MAAIKYNYVRLIELNNKYIKSIEMKFKIFSQSLTAEDRDSIL